MSANMIRCTKCLGQKGYYGIGGLYRDCDVCDKTGKIEAPKRLEAIPEEPVTQTVSVSEAFASMGIPAAIIAEAAATEAVDKALAQSQANFKKKEETKVDELMQAVLDEPRMTPEMWKAKYQHVERLFGRSIITGCMEEMISKVQRAQMRANHAMQTPMAPRTVDLGKAQDMAVQSDPEYKAYVAQEKMRTEKLVNVSNIKKEIKAGGA